jgi:HEAT repeat protein
VSLGIWRGWWLAVWAALGRGGWLDPGPVSQVLAGVVGALLGVLGGWWLYHRQRRDAQPAPVAGRADRLSRSEVDKADPYQLGVYESTLAARYQAQGTARPPYVPRARDDELTRLLTHRKLVLVVGRSRAGKSRTAFEVAARVLPAHRLVAPRDRAELLRLAALGPARWARTPTLIWLDELERYLPTETKDGLDASILARWERIPGVVVLATMRAEERDARRRIPGELGQRVRHALDRFQPATVLLPVEFADPDERQAIARLYPDLRTTRLAEQLAAVPELRRKLDDASPVQHALVQAAVDWRRAGLDRLATAVDLWVVAERTLDIPGRLPQVAIEQQAQVNAALEWACEPVADTAALLERHPGPPEGYRASDPIVDYLTDQNGPQLSTPSVWEALLALTSPQEKLKLAAAAWDLTAPRAATRALTVVVDDAEPTVAMAVAQSLQDRPELTADVGLAQAVYRRLLDHPDPQVVAHAAEQLGVLNPGGAAEDLRRLLDHPDPGVVAVAAEQLSVLDPGGTGDDLRRLLDHPDPRVVAIAAEQLSTLDPDAAHDHLRKLLDHPDPQVVTSVAGRLGALDPDGVSDALRKLLDRHGTESIVIIAEQLLGHPESQVSAVAIGYLANQEPALARATLQRQLHHHDPRVVANANWWIARLDPDDLDLRDGWLLEGDDYEREVGLERLLSEDDPDVIADTVRQLLISDRMTAADTLRDLLDHHDPEVVAHAAEQLGALDPDGAADELRRLLDHPDPRVVTVVAGCLGALDPDDASDDLRQLLHHHHPEVVVHAAEQLGVLDPYGAADLWRRLLDHPDPEVVREAARRLAGLDPDEAANLWRRLLDHPNPEVVREAATRLAGLDPAGAANLWRRLLDHPNPEVVALATTGLAGKARRHSG